MTDEMKVPEMPEIVPVAERVAERVAEYAIPDAAMQVLLGEFQAMLLAADNGALVLAQRHAHGALCMLAQLGGVVDAAGRFEFDLVRRVVQPPKPSTPAQQASAPPPAAQASQSS